MHHDHAHQIQQALGTDVVQELLDAQLLPQVVVPNTVGADASVLGDRIHGAVFGVAIADALVGWVRTSKHRLTSETAMERWLAEGEVEPAPVSAATQLFVQSAESWQQHGWSAPIVLADELVARADGLRSPGHAVRRTVRGLEQGRPWHRAASSSYGDAALPRAVAVGLASLAEPSRAPLAGALDAVVTHPSKQAALCSATLAALTVALVNRPAHTSWQAVARDVVGSVEHEPTRELFERALVPSEVPPCGDWQGDVRPHADQILAMALWSLHADDQVRTITTAMYGTDGNRSAVAVAAALAGAIHGGSALPARTGSVEGSALLAQLAHRLAAPAGAIAPAPVAPDDSPTGADIWFLLDRSGSMSSITHHVVAGFEQFFAEQRSAVGDATVTVVQFDDGDPHDVLVDARPIGEVHSIADRFAPRGCTPLYDAIGRLLDRAERLGGAPDDQLVVIFTDGLENASTDWTQRRIFSRIGRLRAKGWTFVFLGANQDSYEVGDGMAMASGNVSNFRADRQSVAASYTGLSRSVREYRSKSRAARRRDQDDFWGGVKEGEQA